jgi:Tfp pilus assembly protein PilF
LVYKGFVDFDGSSFSVHPIIRNYFFNKIPRGSRASMHRIAADYYDSSDRRLRLENFENNAILFELIHHLALCGDLKRLSEIRTVYYDEMFSSARELYSDGEYEKALPLFISLSEMRPKDPWIWACIGRCYGRRYQWSDCDQSFRKAIIIAEQLKQTTWWIHRDWGHIVLRLKDSSEAKQHLDDAKKNGGKSNPSVIASEGFIAWKNKDISEAKRLFEWALKIDPSHGYTLNTYQKLLRTIGDEESLQRAEELNNKLREISGQMIAKPTFDIDMTEDDDI